MSLDPLLILRRRENKSTPKRQRTENNTSDTNYIIQNYKLLYEVKY